jgi:hypothetical protein
VEDEFMVVSTGHQHHAALVPHIDALRELADEAHDMAPDEVVRQLSTELAFVQDQLLPHMEMAEHTLYPQLELLLGDPQAMEPMRREHLQVRRFVKELEGLRSRLAERGTGLLLRDEFRLRRVLYRVYSMMRVHLHEEEHYLAIIDHNEPASQVTVLREAMQHGIQA